MNKVSTQPYKGARDFYPEQMQLRSYIFDTWRKAVSRYGFEEYDAPIIEPFDLFASKSGEEIVNQQLFSFEDKKGRKLAVRPEITPSTVRMISGRYNELFKPLRWFMIGNNWRFEKPQKGRGREFFQLEVNIFGEQGVAADFEIFEVIVSIMSAFGANEEHYSIHVSDRKLINALLAEELKLDAEKQLAVRRLMDKWNKMSEEEFRSILEKEGLDENQINSIERFMRSDLDNLGEVISPEILDNNKGFQDIARLFSLMQANGLDVYLKFDPSIIRGFDYSDGLVYEVFDKNPLNNRSMFGGERFDNLASVFGDYDLPATGFAMGDITLQEFLEGWEMVPDFEPVTKVFVAVFDESVRENAIELARIFRDKGIATTISLSTDKIDKQFKFADRKNIPFVALLGSDEVKKGLIQLKNMETGDQQEISIEEAIKKLT